MSKLIHTHGKTNGGDDYHYVEDETGTIVAKCTEHRFAQWFASVPDLMNAVWCLQNVIEKGPADFPEDVAHAMKVATEAMGKATTVPTPEPQP